MGGSEGGREGGWVGGWVNLQQLVPTSAVHQMSIGFLPLMHLSNLHMVEAMVFLVEILPFQTYIFPLREKLLFLLLSF